MFSQSKYRIAVILTILFMALITAPTIILSLDDTYDVSCFYSINEEEENENLKLVFEKISLDPEFLIEDNVNSHLIGYTFKHYPKPHLNLISPPPDFI